MPISGPSYTIPNGATTAAPGQTVQSAVWNSIFADLQTSINQIVSNNYYGINSFRNMLYMNGSFNVWQRGSSVSVAASTTAYTSDRWYVTTGANQASTIARATGLNPRSQYCGKVQRNSGQTGVTAYTFGYALDTNELAIYLGQKIYLQATVKTGANWSPTNGTLSVAFYVGTGSASRRGAGFTNEVAVIPVTNTNIAVSTQSNILVQSTVVIPTTSTQGELQFTWTPTGTAGVDDSISIDDVQIQIVSPSGVAIFTTYDYIPFSTELISCKRHYTNTFPYGTAPANAAGNLGALACMSQAAAQFGVMWIFTEEMRVTPTMLTYNPAGASANWQDVTAAASLAVTVNTSVLSPKSVFMQGASAAAAAHLIYIHSAADSTI